MSDIKPCSVCFAPVPAHGPSRCAGCSMCEGCGKALTQALRGRRRRFCGRPCQTLRDKRLRGIIPPR